MIAPAQPRQIGGVALAGILGGGTPTNPTPPPGYITDNMLADAYALAADLTTETSRAETAEADLGTQITQAVSAAVINANEGIMSESQARVAAIAAIQETLNTLTTSVANTATNVGVFNATLGNQINNEASTRASADTALSVQISSLKTSLANEAARATTAEGQRLQIAKNLSDLTNVAAARTNLGLGTAAQSDMSQFDAAGAAATVNNSLTAEITRAQTAESQRLAKSANLGDLASVTAARTNLGLGSAATQSTSAFDPAGSANTERVRAEAVEATLAPLNQVLLLNTSPQTVVGTVNFTGTTEINGQAVVTTNDSRLSDTRNPNPGSVGTTGLGDGAVTSAKVSPTAGILATQLATAVQTSLGLANTSIQSVNTKEGASITLAASDVGAIPTDIVTTKGDLIIAANTGEPIRVAVGTDGNVLTADSTSDYGVSWKAPTGGGGGGGGGGAVSSVFGRTGAVVGSSGDYAVGQITGAAPLASPTLTGTVLAPTPTAGDSSTKVATTAFVAGGFLPLVQNVHTVSSSGAAQTIPGPATATSSLITLTANCTFTFPTPAAGASFYIALQQDVSGSRLVTWDTAVVWPSGTPPTLTTSANKTDWFFFTCIDGVHYLGNVIGQNYSIFTSGGSGPALVMTQVDVDTFTRSNGNIAGSNSWLANTDGTMFISSNEAVGGGSANLGNYRSDTYDSDHYSEITLGSLVNVSGGLIGVTTRNQTNGGCYLAGYLPSSSAVNMYKRDIGGSFTQIGGFTPLNPSFPLSTGSTIRLVSEGNHHTTYVSGIPVMSYYDADLTGGTPGIASGGSINSANHWAGGNAHTGTIGPTLVTDNFNRANGGASVGQANWTVMSGYPAVDIPIVSNQLNVSTGSHAAIVRTDSIWNPDQWSSIQQGTNIITANNGAFIGMLTRVNSGLNSGYLFVFFGNGLSPLNGAFISYDIYRLDSGTSTWLGGVSTVGAGNSNLDPVGTTYAGISQGNTHYFWVNSHMIFKVTDSTYASGKPGIMMFPQSTGTTADNWAGGNV